MSRIARLVCGLRRICRRRHHRLITLRRCWNRRLACRSRKITRTSRVALVSVLGIFGSALKLLCLSFFLFFLKIFIPAIIEQCLASISIDSFTLKQYRSHQVHLIATGRQDLLCTIVSFFHDARNFVIDSTSRIVGVILRIAIITSQEYFVIRLSKHLNAKL